MPTSPTEITPTVAPTEIKWWIIPAVLCPILLIIVIILLICWRWKKGAPKSRVEPDTIRMLDTNKRKVSVVVASVFIFLSQRICMCRCTGLKHPRDVYIYGQCGYSAVKIQKDWDLGALCFLASFPRCNATQCFGISSANCPRIENNFYSF